MKKIYTILVCLCMLAGFVACEKDKEFVLTTLTVTNETVTPSYETAEVSCSFKADATISEAYVQYSLSSGFAKYDVAKMTEEKGKYVALLTDLVDNTTYYIRYAVSNKYSSVVTEEVVECQTLQCTVPTIVLDSIGEVRESHAKAYLHLTFDGGASVTDMGICWSKQANPTIEDIHKSTKDTVAILDITDLQENTTYYVRAYAVNKVGVAYSEEKEFVTNKSVVLPSVTTTAITQITETSAVAGGNVTSDGNASVTERGVVYSTKQNPTISDNKELNGSGVGSFVCGLTNLHAGTTYYVRAYATNEKGTAYGEEESFTTNENNETGTENGYAYVDLGLSVKWATCNVGANNPEDYGDYFAWGETTTKATYDWSTYKYCNGSSSTLTKYCNKSSYGNNGFTDNKTQLELSDDAAYVNWGGAWRMPSDAEWTELREQCTWTWTTQNGVYGRKVTSKTNGNSIFLPAAGWRNDTSLYGAGGSGDCWSSSLDTDNPILAWSAYFDSGYVYRIYNYRYYGRSVRPVLGESVVETTIPTVTTTIPTQITETTAVAGGNVTSDGGASVTERGVVYATTQNPTTNNTKVMSGTGTGSFTCNLTDLQPNTTYYVRAYATNEVGTAYGEEVSLTTKVEVVDNPSSNLRAMPFSVSESKQVYFSKGNLQYHPANNEWRFAESQLDYIGGANSNCSSTYNGWLDLFGWSTSATNFGVSTSTDNNDYSGSFVDWGTNSIGSDTPNTWRTLTYDEWYYLRYTRTNADDLVGIAQVNGVNGLILLPDNWVCPEGITFKSGFHSNYADYQTFTAVQWPKLESAGAVFLPAAGRCYGTLVSHVKYNGYYWSATELNSSIAYCLSFISDEASMDIYGVRCHGYSVRLVKDLQQETVKSLPSVTTAVVTQITETTAVAGGNVTSDGGAEITERGVVYATTQNPTTNNTKVTSGIGTGSFTCNLTDLQPNTTYYVRAYAINEKGTAYGEEVTFTTNKQIVLPSVTTAAITQITETSAVAGGNVTSDGGASVTERGVVYSTNPNPVITNLNNTIRPCGSGTGAFTYTMTGLQPNTTYYVRAYATNEVGTAYGEEVSFTTKEQSSTPNNGTENGYAYVDLGLSVKWATMNVGATKPEEYGNYFAWGEIEPKEVYDWSTYKWCNGTSEILTKYNTINSYGTVDDKILLELFDDAARANWGGSWRMPTDAELTELREQCTWEWTTQNGVNGYKVTSKSNGNSIFLPAAGISSGNSHYNAGSYGDYWSISLYTSHPIFAWSSRFDYSNVEWGYDYRYSGHSVRPVCP